jgi:hypothetical protein
VAPTFVTGLTIGMGASARTTVKSPSTDGGLTGFTIFSNMTDLFATITDMVSVATRRGWRGGWARGISGAGVSSMTTFEK